VLFRVTPVFDGNNLVASGVLMEAESVEDRGAGVQFCVWCYNVEPGVRIDYATGKNEADGTMSDAVEDASESSQAGDGDSGETARPSAPAAQAANDIPEELRADEASATYVFNANSRKFHVPDCPSVADMSARNKLYFGGTREQAVDLGYEPCGYCKP
jgi:DNA-entry nuclease